MSWNPKKQKFRNSDPFETAPKEAEANQILSSDYDDDSGSNSSDYSSFIWNQPISSDPSDYASYDPNPPTSSDPSDDPNPPSSSNSSDYSSFEWNQPISSDSSSSGWFF